jgi:hypothetical protein
MRLTRRAGDRLQRALEGEQVTDREITTLLQTAQAVSSIPMGSTAPREQFVQDLRDRLMAEAATLPAPTGRAAPASAAARTGGRSAPVVVVVGRGLPRALAGAAASALVVGSVVGVASRSAIPGSALYPVKGWLDSVAVQMADSDLDRGLTHLSQAQEHIADTRALVELGEDDSGPYLEALQGAVSSVRAGQRDLNAAFDSTGNPQALIAARDFSARALPQVEALRPEVPAASLPALSELEALLQQSESAALRRLASCAPTCVTLQQVRVGPSDLPSLPTSGAPGTAAPSGSTRGGVTVPQTAVTADPDGGGPGPGVTAGSGGVTLGGDNGGATLSTDGTNLNGPTVSASVTGLPGVSATLPSVGVSTGGVDATVPGTTLGGITLPGITATVPLP